MTIEFTVDGGYTVDDMLHFGFDHIDTGMAILRGASPSCYDSAGYIINLGIELILKAWHLHEFKFFKSTHVLKNLTDKLHNHNSCLTLNTEEEKTLKMVDSWYQLRYPRREEGPIEIGSENADLVESLLDSIWQQFPEPLVAAYKSLTSTKKGGRVLMKKKIEVTDA